MVAGIVGYLIGNDLEGEGFDAVRVPYEIFRDSVCFTLTDLMEGSVNTRRVSNKIGSLLRILVSRGGDVFVSAFGRTLIIACVEVAGQNDGKGGGECGLCICNGGELLARPLIALCTVSVMRC